MQSIRYVVRAFVAGNNRPNNRSQQTLLFCTRSQRKNQHHKSPEPSLELNQKQPSHYSLSSTSKLLKRLAYYPLNSITRLALRALFQVGRQPVGNVQSATTSINRALRYSVGVPSPNRSAQMATTRRRESPLEEDDVDSAADTMTNKLVGSSLGEDDLTAMENHDRDNTLDSLRRTYDSCRKHGTNIWLDFANKSCYIYLYRGGGEPNASLAAFDLDGTLIKPKSNKRIPRSATDWDFFSVWTKIKLLQCLRERHSRFVIFTNQNGVGLEIVPLEEVQHRIELVTKRLDIPCTVFVAIERDIFRKPKTGMFSLFDKSFNGTVQVDFANSFYCGDAIGYPSHSDADIKFAQQLGFPFLTPEKFLRGVKPKLIGTS